jgi:hypothetical protein
MVTSRIVLASNNFASMQNNPSQPPAGSFTTFRAFTVIHHGMHSVTLAGHYVSQAEQLSGSNRTEIGRVLQIMLERLWHEHFSIPPPPSTMAQPLQAFQVHRHPRLVGVYESILFDNHGRDNETLQVHYLIQASQISEAEFHEADRVIRIMLWALGDYQQEIEDVGRESGYLG